MDTVGVRQFREELASYLMRTRPFAVTNHGRVVGYFYPVPDHEAAASSWERLKQGAAEMEAFLESIGVTEDEIIAEVNELRKRDFQLRSAADRSGREYSDENGSRDEAEGQYR